MLVFERAFGAGVPKDHLCLLIDPVCDWTRSQMFNRNPRCKLVTHESASDPSEHLATEDIIPI